MRRGNAASTLSPSQAPRPDAIQILITNIEDNSTRGRIDRKEARSPLMIDAHTWDTRWCHNAECLPSREFEASKAQQFAKFDDRWISVYRRNIAADDT